MDEIRAAVSCIRKYSDSDLVLLHCVLEYPTPYEHANLAKISALKETFPNVIIGYSDHTKPDVCYDVIKTAYLLGAMVIEKHFTVDKTLQGNDHYHAMDTHDAEKILEGVAYLDALKGKDILCALNSEKSARENARRSIVAAVDIPIGAILTEEMLTFKRPGHGISPSKISDILGRKAKNSIAQDVVLTRDMLE